MRPFFLSYKSITISWFMAFAFLLVLISSFIAKLMAREYDEDKEKVDDIFFIVILSGFIGSRLFYVLANFNLYEDNIGLIFKISHYNLSLIGGLITGLFALMILARRNKIEFQKLLKIFVIPFYFSMAVGIWLVSFDKLLLAFKISNNPIKILYISLIFLLGMILEVLLSNKIKSKYISPIILGISMALYYII